MLTVSEDERGWCVLSAQAFMQCLLNTFCLPSVLYLALGMWSWTRRRCCPHGICRDRRGTHQGLKDEIIIRTLTEVCTGWFWMQRRPLIILYSGLVKLPQRVGRFWGMQKRGGPRGRREEAGMQGARGRNQHEADGPRCSSSQHSYRASGPYRNGRPQR